MRLRGPPRPRCGHSFDAKILPMLAPFYRTWNKLVKPIPRGPQPYVLDVLTLEDRILYSATPLLIEAADAAATSDAVAAADLQTIDQLAAAVLASELPLDSLPQDVDSLNLTDAELSLVDLPQNFEPTSESSRLRHELIFVDRSLDKVDSLLQDLLAQSSADRQFEVVYLDRDADGFAQVESALAGETRYDALHFLTHGESGRVQLGNSTLDFGSIEQRLEQIQDWSDSLTEDADLLFYACEAATDADGQTLLTRISEITGADVAGSDDLTGSKSLGGNWDLEFQFGSIETVSLASVGDSTWEGLLAVYSVTNTNDSGAGSLRQAILNANANPGADTIDFSIAGVGVQIIALASDLPAITESVALDATTQAGYAGTPLIALDGSGVTGSTAGLLLEGSNITVRGFAIYGFNDDGVEIAGNNGPGDNNLVENNWIGIRADGTAAGNADVGALVTAGASGNTFRNNVIANNGSHGILIRNAGTDNNVFIGNIIGLNVAGTAAMANGGSGIRIFDYTSNNQIGGTGVGEGNVISGNNSYGIQLIGYANNNQILGNFIGTNLSGTAVIGNTLDGVIIQDNSDGNTIGGTTAAARNIISGNRDGIFLQGAGVTDNVIQGNYIGTDISGTVALGNSQYGIRLADSAANNLIGGTVNGAGNRIAHNTLAGIALTSTAGSGNSMLRNEIYSNGGLGIDLNNDGVSLNDNGDGDSGPNDLLNMPLPDAVSSNGSQILVSGSLLQQAVPNSYYRIEIFQSSARDPALYGEGQTYLGSLHVQTDASGIVTGSLPLPYAVPVGSFLTATVTETNAAGTTFGSTSEFSPALLVIDQGPTNTVPGNQSTNENTPRVFSAANGNQISISDNAGEVVVVTLAVTNGTLTLSQTTGLSFTSGTGTGNTTMTFSGTVANINAALNGLQYVPTTDYNGGAVLSITSADQVLYSANLDPNLLGHFEFHAADPGNDSSPGGTNDGTFNGDATIVNDPVRGDVLSLDGSGDSFQIDSLFGTPTSITIGGWVNLTEAGVRQDFISVGDHVLIALDQPGTGVKGSIQTAAGTWNDLGSGIFIANTGWHHVMYSFDDVNDMARLYIDGIEVASEMITDSIYWTGSTTTYVGQHPIANFDLQGLADDIRIYDRVLSASEVAELASAPANFSDSDSVGITVQAVNDAPFLDNSGTMTLTSINENQTTNGGDTVAAIIASAGGDRITDPDASAVEGIAITASSSTYGTWQYSTNGGSNWNNVGTVSDNSALLLRSTDLVRFVPNAQNGESADITFRAWDQTTGSFGTKVDVSTNGGTTAFSTSTESASITVTSVNDAPLITSDGGGPTANLNVAENSSAVTTVTATDVDLPAQTLTYSIIGGADAGLFNIDPNTGVLTFNSAPDFEAPADAGGDNIYNVVVQVSDGNGGNDSQAITVTVTPVNDNLPVITSNGGGPTAMINVNENTSAVTIVTATDADLPGQTLTYSILGGADAAQFQIDANTGVLSFIVPPDFENPLDAGGDNVYNVIVQVNDNNGGTATQAIVVTVVNANERPQGTSGTRTIDEDTFLVFAINDFGFVDADTGDTLQAVRINSFSSAGSLTLAGVAVTAGQIIDVADLQAGQLQLTPIANQNGANYATLNFTVQDRAGLTSTNPNVLTLNVTSINDAPVAVPESFSIFSGELLIVTAPGLLANDSDVDGDALSVILVQPPLQGSLTLQADGSFQFLANPAFFGTVTFTYQASDGSALSAPTTVQITITPFAGGDSEGSNSGTSGGNSKTDNENGNGGASLIPALPIDDTTDNRSRGVLSVIVPDSSSDSGSSRSNATAEEELALRPLNSGMETIPGVYARRADPIANSRGDRERTDLAELTSPEDVQALNLLLNSLRNELLEQREFRQIAATTATAATAALSAGYALWTLKSGHLLASLLTGMPAWKHLDPLAVVSGTRRIEEDDEESLADIAGQTV